MLITACFAWHSAHTGLAAQRCPVLALHARADAMQVGGLQSRNGSVDGFVNPVPRSHDAYSGAYAVVPRRM